MGLKSCDFSTSALLKNMSLGLAITLSKKVMLTRLEWFSNKTHSKAGHITKKLRGTCPLQASLALVEEGRCSFTDGEYRRFGEIYHYIFCSAVNGCRQNERTF